MIVVSDSSPLISLASVGRLELLQALYGRVLIPQAVRDEVSGDLDRRGAREVLAAEWIEVRAASDTIDLFLARTIVDEGEAQAIGLAIELDAELLIVDERSARNLAETMGLRPVGVVGVLLEAKARGLLAVIKPILDALYTHAGFYLSRKFYEAVLRAAGE